ncbi:CoA transferase [Aeromicrobium sp. UC242_57]|uniref:CoA transferase n=1 Tax=Aeromicrobium sp. UC242_57 TaxID=3374624 RepID=UPI0037B97321
MTRPIAELWPDSSNVGPLSGVRVVDFGQYIAGPMTAMLLADQGADVIRVDPPGGPRWRSRANAALLRGRRRAILDLTTARDRARAHALVRSADVVVENFRPGVMDRLGLGAENCLAAAPHLVYCSLPGFAAADPRAGLPGWRVVMAAGGGYAPLPSLIDADSGQGPAGVPDFSPAPLASVLAAMEGAMGIAAALVARQRDGIGQRVEAPLYNGLFEAGRSRAMTYERNPPAFSYFGSGVYLCADGRSVTFLANWFRHLRLFVEAAGCQAWIDEGLVASWHCVRTRRRVSRFSVDWSACSPLVTRSTGKLGPGEWMHDRHGPNDKGVAQQSRGLPGLAQRLISAIPSSAVPGFRGLRSRCHRTEAARSRLKATRGPILRRSSRPSTR